MILTASAVDLFCGVGGLTHGLIKAGIKVNAGIDTAESCRYSYEKNNDSLFIKKDIKEISSEYLRSLYPDNDIKILAGCAPCQPFSTHTQKVKDRKKDERWGLLNYFTSFVEDIKPEIVSMENVPQLAKQTVFFDFLNKLASLNYYVSWQTVYCPDYGIPQTRKRLVLLASLFGEIKLLPETHTPETYRTVLQSIGTLPPIDAGSSLATDLLHKSSYLRETNLKRVKASKPGGTWKDWDVELRSPCHKRESGKSYGGVYARMAWNKPSPTITTQFYNYGTGRFGHPEQDRALSLREGALLQTFPDYYDFINPDRPLSIKIVGRQIGNAIPIRLAIIIGRSIVKHLEGVSNG